MTTPNAQNRSGTLASTTAATRPAASFQRVKEHLRAGIAQGKWAPSQQLPSEAQLTAQFGVSRMTVNRALRELQQEGFIDRLQGVGSFVADGQRVASTLTLQDIHDEIAARGHEHRALVLTQESVRAGVVVAEHLGLRSGQTVFHSVIVHHEDATPLQLEERWVNPAAAPEYLAQDFTQQTPTHYLLQVAPLPEARYVIVAAAATAFEAQILRIEPGAPCLRVERTTSVQGVAVSHVRLLHPGNRFALRGEFRW